MHQETPQESDLGLGFTVYDRRINFDVEKRMIFPTDFPAFLF